MVQYTEEEMRAQWSRHPIAGLCHGPMPTCPEAITGQSMPVSAPIEHGCLLDDASARLMAQKGAYLVPTMVIYQQLKQFRTEVQFPRPSRWRNLTSW